jgi:hypothetical protein
VNADTWKTGPLLGVCIGVAAGAVVWLIIQLVHPVFWTTEGADEWGFLPLEVQWALDRNNSMFVLALLSGLTAAVLAAGEAFHRGSWKWGLSVTAGWTAIALLTGGLAGYLGHRVFELVRHNHDLAELKRAMYTYGVMFAISGLGIGLGAGAAAGRSFRAALQCALAGALAGGLAAVGYALGIAMLLPAALTSVLIPTEAVDRLLWFGLFSGLVGLIIPALARHSFAAPLSERDLPGGR